jgi:hypothetical protein
MNPDFLTDIPNLQVELTQELTHEGDRGSPTRNRRHARRHDNHILS